MADTFDPQDNQEAREVPDRPEQGQPGQPGRVGRGLGRRLRSRKGTRPLVATAMVLGTLAASIAIGHEVWPTDQGTAGRDVAASSSSTSATDSVASVAAKVDPALVDVNVTFAYQQASGAGTGIVLTSNGEVLTNNHVVEGATSISVTDVGNGRTYQATVVGYDRSADVAVLQLKHASGLATARIAKASEAKVGQEVVAIGNAGGTGGTPTAAAGTITALNQAVTPVDELTGTSESLTGLIETDADIQSGDSGGSLVDTSGEVVGMDTAAETGSSLGSQYGQTDQTEQGYAIPIHKALSIASQIEAGHGSSSVHVGATAFLGVLSDSSESGTSESGSRYGYYGYAGDGEQTAGVTVSGVVESSAAEQAGLTAGDVITSFGGHAVDSSSQLTDLISGYRPGEKVQIGWTDQYGQTHTATVTLGSGPAQ